MAADLTQYESLLISAECPVDPFPRTGHPFWSLPDLPWPAPGDGGRPAIAPGPARPGHSVDTAGTRRECGQQTSADRPGLAKKHRGRHQPACAHGGVAQSPRRWSGRPALHRHSRPAWLQFCSALLTGAGRAPSRQRRPPTERPQPARAPHPPDRAPVIGRQSGGATAAPALHHPGRPRRHRQDHRGVARRRTTDRALSGRHSPAGPGTDQRPVGDHPSPGDIA